MAIKVNKEIKEVIALISNIFEAFTVAYYDFEPSSNVLKLVYHYSLSGNIKDNFSLNIGKNLKIWIMNFNKPLSSERAGESDYDSLLNIYGKSENIKSFFAVIVGNYRGIVYIDTKKSYAFPEKEQKLLRHCANILELLFKIEDSAKNIKEFIDYSEIAKRVKLQIASGNIDASNLNLVIDKIANILKFEFGVLIINEFSDKMKLVATNHHKLQSLAGRSFPIKETVIGTFLMKKVKNVKFHDIPVINDGYFFTKIEKFNKEKILNYLYFPFYTAQSIMGAFIFFNFKQKYNFNKLCHYLYDIFYPLVYENTVRESLNSIVTKEPVTGFTRDYYFFKVLESSSMSSKGLIFIRNKKIYTLLKKYSLQTILKSYKTIKNHIEKFLNNEDVEGVLIALDRIALLVTINNMRDFLLKKNLIIKTFQSRLIKVENFEIALELDIEIFENLAKSKSEVLKISYK